MKYIYYQNASSCILRYILVQGHQLYSDFFPLYMGQSFVGYNHVSPCTTQFAVFIYLCLRNLIYAFVKKEPGQKCFILQNNTWRESNCNYIKALNTLFTHGIQIPQSMSKNSEIAKRCTVTLFEFSTASCRLDVCKRIVIVQLFVDFYFSSM